MMWECLSIHNFEYFGKNDRNKIYKEREEVMGSFQVRTDLALEARAVSYTHLTLPTKA